MFKTGSRCLGVRCALSVRYGSGWTTCWCALQASQILAPGMKRQFMVVSKRMDDASYLSIKSLEVRLDGVVLKQFMTIPKRMHQSAMQVSGLPSKHAGSVYCHHFLLGPISIKNCFLPRPTRTTPVPSGLAQLRTVSESIMDPRQFLCMKAQPYHSIAWDWVKLQFVVPLNLIPHQTGSRLGPVRFLPGFHLMQAKLPVKLQICL